MPVPIVCPVSLAPEAHARLALLVRTHSTPHALAFRWRLILLRPRMAPGCIKWSGGLAFWRGGSSSAAIMLRSTILTRACQSIWKSTIPITRIPIGGPIRANHWSGRYL